MNEKDKIEVHGNVGNYISDGNIISFQIGDGQQLFSDPSIRVPWGSTAIAAAPATARRPCRRP